MSTPPVKLYTAEVLALATQLARWPLDPAMPHQGTARSQSCGSTLAVSLVCDNQGRISGIGIGAQACAIGQASAAIFAQSALGLGRNDIAQAAITVEAWLKNNAPLSDWPGLEVIAAAQTYPARHGALLLPWRAALDALP